MIYYEAPYSVPPQHLRPSLFLAGGISGCPPWQYDLRDLLQDSSLTLLNPLRAQFPMDNPDSAREQIHWEHTHLAAATAISFWFPCETLCPITLFELGAWAYWRSEHNQPKPLFVGVHPDYARRQDVEIQLALARPEVEVVLSLEELATQVKRWQLQVLADESQAEGA